jgi:hypothetical protein
VSAGHRVSAASGWRWVACGWTIYLASPGMWLVLAAAFTAVMLVLSMIPLVGGLAVSLLAPVLAAGLLFGAAQLQAGRRLRLGHLVQGFVDGAALPRLLGLGVTAMAVNLAAGVALLIWLAMTLAPLLYMPIEPAGVEAVLIGRLAGLAVIAIVLLTAYLLLGCALAYAVPLVLFRGTAVLAAMRSSIGACLRNWLAWIVASLVLLLVLAVLAVALFAVVHSVMPLNIGQIDWPPPTDPLALLDALPVRFLAVPVLVGVGAQSLFAPLVVAVLYCSFLDVYRDVDAAPGSMPGQED